MYSVFNSAISNLNQQSNHQVMHNSNVENKLWALGFLPHAAQLEGDNSHR